jgi:alpha-glucosidase/alpha-D-xyloside xylohydrolase
MSSALSRRRALKKLGAAGAGLVLAPTAIRAQENRFVVGGREVEASVISLGPFSLRIALRPLSGPASFPDDGALVAAASEMEPLSGGDLRVRFTKEPPALLVETESGRLVQRLTLDPASHDVSFLLPRGPLFGMGQGGPQFDRKGSVDAMKNGQGGYRLRTHGGRVPIQWLVGTDGWGMFLHQPLGTFDFTGVEGRLRVARPPDKTEDAVPPLDVFLVVSEDPAKIVGEYARLTGYAEMPARWTFGYQQSHRTLSGPEEIQRVARTLREKKLPCDTLIYLGTEFTPSGWNTRNGEFSFHPENFPEPPKQIDDLRALHYKVVLHVVIEGERLIGTVDDPCSRAEPSGRDSENRWPPDRRVGCYWPYHRSLMELGVDGFWPDQGDDYDPPSRLNRIRMYWEGMQQVRPNERPYALHRNGYAGMQRYGAFLWSGDVYSTWETLSTHVPVAINSGLSGIPFWGFDIGGFVPTSEYTGELHVRWFQFGAFSPLFRAHGRNWHLRLPWGWNTGTLPVSEIVNYRNGAADPDPSELRNPLVEPICRKYLELRYRLMPYLYSAVRECTLTGLPIQRALWLHYPDDPSAVARGDEYLWGRDMLVAPVVEKGATSRRFYLPRGVWYDYWTNEPLDGGREIERAVDLETTPLYVRAGALIPHDPVRQYTSEPVAEPATVVVYPGADGHGRLYEDDGVSFDYRGGDWMGIDLTWRDADRSLSMRLAPGSRMLSPSPRRFLARVAGSTETRSVTFHGEPVEIRL